VRIELTRSGGLAGLRQAAAVDDAALPPQERDELLRLAAAADLWSLPERLEASRAEPDRFRYRIAVDDGARRRELSVAEEAMPEALRPLVRWLEARAHPARR